MYILNPIEQLNIEVKDEYLFLIKYILWSINNYLSCLIICLLEIGCMVKCIFKGQLTKHD